MLRRGRVSGGRCRPAALIVLTLVRPQRGGPLRLCGDGQRRVDAQVRRDRGAVHHIHRRVAVDPVVGVDDPVLGAVADHRAAEEVRGQRNVEQLAPGAAGHAVDLGGDTPGDLVADRDPASGSARRGPACWSTSGCPACPRLVNVVIELSRCCITSAITVRSLHCRGLSIRIMRRGSSPACCSNCLQRGTSVPCGPEPSVIRVCSSPIALEPLP